MQLDLEPARQLQQIVRRTRAKLRARNVWMGVCALVVCATVWLILLTLIDLFMPLSVGWRIFACAGFWLISVGIAVALVLWPGIKPMRLEQVAMRIEKTIPQMHNRLITVLDILTGRKQDYDVGFTRRLIEQARQRLSDFNVHSVIPSKPIRQRLVAAGVSVLLLLLIVGIFHNRAPRAIARLFAPTADLPPASSIDLTVTPGDTQVLFGNDLNITANVSEPKLRDMALYLKLPSEGWVQYPMTPVGDHDWQFTLEKVTSNLTYRVVGAGTWTVAHDVQMIKRPSIESVAYSLKFPDYMRSGDPQLLNVDQQQISAPLESNVLITAAVSGKPVKGLINFVKPVRKETKTQQPREIVWFDDNTPDDAKLIGRWRWHESDAYSGARSHGFSWGSKRYGFKTRLNILTLRKEQDLVVYYKLDEKQPAGRITLHFIADDVARQFHWDSQQSPLERDVQLTPAYIGQLQEPGGWHVLKLTHEQLQPKKNSKNDVKISSIEFEVDDGKVLFDRAATREMVDQVHTEVVYEPAAREPVAFERVGGSDWSASLPVTQSCHFTIAFSDSYEHASLPVAPIEVVSLIDQQPTAVVDRPGQNVTLDRAELMPVVVNTFDDYGIARVGLRTGKEPDKLGDPVWINEYPAPKPNRTVLSSLDPNAYKMQPGDTIWYQFVAEDRKQQQGSSEMYRLTLAAASESQDESSPGSSPGMRDLLEGLDKLAAAQNDLTKMAGDLLTGKLLDKDDEGEEELDKDAVTAQLLGEDGQPLSVDEIREMYETQLHQLPDEDRLLYVDQLSHTLDEQAIIIDELADAFEKQAIEAQESMTALPTEAAVVGEIAQQLRMMRRPMGKTQAAQYMTPEQQRDLLEKMAMMQVEQLSEQEQNEAEQLRDQLDQLMQAHDGLGQQPEMSQAQMNDLMLQMQASRAQRDLGQLIGDLKTQRQRLEQMREQVASLQRDVASAKSADEVQGAAKQQQVADEQANEMIDKTKQMLAQQQAPEVEQIEQRELPMPWETFAPDDESEKNPEWWDQPIDEKQLVDPGENADTPKPDAPPAAPSPRDPSKMQTPREQLAEHQTQMQDALKESGKAAGTAENRLQTLRDRIDALRKQMASADDPSQAGEGEQGKTASCDVHEHHDAGCEDCAAGGPPMVAPRQQLQGMLESQQMRMLQAVAARGMLQQQQAQQGEQGEQQQQEQMPGPSAGPMQTSDFRPGYIMYGEMDELDLTADEGARLYRLPPEKRVPIVQGMREKGPEGYQPMIDAYFRELTRQSSQEDGK